MFQTLTETKVLLKPEIKTFTTHTSEPHWPLHYLTEPAMLEKV